MISTPPQIKATQIIVGALIIGAAALASVAAVVVNSSSFAPRGRSASFDVPMGVMLAASFFGGVVGAIVFGRFVVQANRKGWAAHPEPTPELMLLPFQNLTIIRAALLEGSALFGGVGLLMTGQWWMLAVTGLSVLGLMIVFPTRDRFERFVADVARPSP